ncbi:hypothetical protein ACOTJB_23845 [Achromobacter xylosoxidans]
MTDKAEFERLLDVYGFRCERFGQDLSTHARAQVVSAFAALASAPVAGEAKNYPGDNVAERLDKMADDQPPGSQAQSDLYAAATIWRKHIAHRAAPQASAVAGEAQPSRQTLLDAIWRHGNARAMAEHNIACRDEVRNTADALIALFDAAPQASAEDDREGLAHKVNLLTAELLGHRSAAGHLSVLVDDLRGHLIDARQAMADFQQAFVPAFDTPETLTMVPNEALAPFCAALDRLCELDLPQADKDGCQQRASLPAQPGAQK